MFFSVICRFAHVPRFGHWSLCCYCSRELSNLGAGRSSVDWTLLISFHRGHSWGRTTYVKRLQNTRQPAANWIECTARPPVAQDRGVDPACCCTVDSPFPAYARASGNLLTISHLCQFLCPMPTFRRSHAIPIPPKQLPNETATSVGTSTLAPQD